MAEDEFVHELKWKAQQEPHGKCFEHDVFLVRQPHLGSLVCSLGSYNNRSLDNPPRVPSIAWSRHFVSIPGSEEHPEVYGVNGP